MLDIILGKLWAVCAYAERELFTIHSLVIYGVIFFASWLFSKLFILPHLSPLSKIPGRPRGNLFLGNLLEIGQKEAIDPYKEWVHEMKTGVIRYHHFLGSQRILIADADAMKHILVTNASNYLRPHFLVGFFSRIVGHSLLTLDGQEHHVQRRLCNSAFKLSSLQNLLPVFQKCAERLCNKWQQDLRDKESIVYDIKDNFTSVTFDIITETGFAYESNSVDNPDENVFQAFNSVLGANGNRLLRIIMGPWYRYLPTKDNREINDNLNLLHSIIQNIINKKRKDLDKKNASAEDSKVQDLLEMLLLALDVESGARLSETQVQDHVMTFMIAGHETTASAMTWALLSLSQHPDIQHKARQEMMSLLPPPGQPITYQDLEKLTYLNCVVKETLRLFPPAPVTMRQAVKDDIICNYVIPKGTIVNICVGALHRNPAYWKDPDDFIPERFQDESSVPLYTYQPFISGPHMCIGYKFALLELKMCLALLLRQFEFSMIPDVVYKKKQFITMRPYPPLKLNVRCVH